MDRLPGEIFMDILSRLPTESLGLSMCVNKKWYTTISTPTFTTLYIKTSSSKTNTNFLIFYKQKNRSNHVYLVENDNESLPSIVKPTKEVNLPFIDPSKMEDLIFLGSCNGLLCVAELNCHVALPIETAEFVDLMTSITSLPSNPIYICNPVTGEYLQLPEYMYPGGLMDIKEFVYRSGFDVVRRVEEFMFGFGFDSIAQEYKAVLVTFYKNDYTKDVIENELQVYTLGSDSWRRRVGVVPDVLIDAFLLFSYVCVDGSLHWITMKDRDTPSCRPLVVSFDLGAEEFKVNSTPESIVMNLEADFPLEYIALGVLEEQLALVDSSSQNFIQIWLQKNDNGEKFWINQLVIIKELVCRSRGEFVMPIKLRNSGEVVLLCNCKYMISYNTESRNCRYLKVHEVCESFDSSFTLVSFVGSLISIRLLQGMASDAPKFSLQQAESHEMQQLHSSSEHFG